MTSQEYLDILAKRWRLVALAVTLGLLLGLGLTAVTTPMYRSSVKVSVNPARPEYGTALTVNNMLANYSLQLTTVRLAQQVVDKLRMDIAPEALLGRLKVTPQQDNFMLLLEVDNADPAVAERIAATMATIFVNENNARNAAASRQDRIDLSVLDDPEPAKLQKPKLEVNLAMGLLAGLALGVLAAFVLEYIDDTLKTADDVERVIAMPTIGAIPANPQRA